MHARHQNDTSSHSSTRYHALHEHDDDNSSNNNNYYHNDDLWDQLNDQQSREVQQHQSRFRAAPMSSRTRPTNIVWSVLHSNAQRLGATVVSAAAAAQHAWKNHQQQHYYQERITNTDLEFDQQFGIHELGQSSQQHVVEESSSSATTSSRAPPRPNPGYPFVVLKQFPRQAIASDRERWGIVGNMDVFLTHLYQYFYHRGLTPMVYKFLVEITSLLFTLWLSRILMKDLDWKKLTTCKDEASCLDNWSDYYRQTPLSWTHWWLVQGYTLLVLGYAAFTSWSFWKSLQQTWTCRCILHDKLGISLRKLQGGAISWDSVVSQLIQAQESGDYRMVLEGSSLDHLVVAQRILRKENFLIAFWNQGLLDTKMWGRNYWCSSLEWCIYSCILNFMFNHKYEIRPAFYLDAASLERRLRVCGVVHLLLLPFLILFVAMHFVFRNVDEFRTTKRYMGNKQWSPVALWQFREFNELPHILEQRLEPSYQAAESYVKLFGQSEWMAALGHLLVYLGGAVGSLLLLFGVMNDAILLHVQLWGRNLLWYAGMAGIVFSVGQALRPTKEAQPSVTRNLFDDMDVALKTVSSHTHYYPEIWKGRGWDSSVYQSFGKFFDSKVKLFLWELAALILAPYILVFKSSKCAPQICEFCLVIKSRVPGAGDVCGYSTFDFDAFKDAAWDGRTLGDSIMSQPNESPPRETLSESIMRTGNVEDATREHPKPRAREGKMEKSFFNFQAAHPSWKCSPSGQNLVDRVEDYRNAEIAAISRERDLHIEAAVRQLETLTKLEKQTSPNPYRRFREERLHDSHIQRVPAADAGAGTSTPEHRARPSSDVHNSPPTMPVLSVLRNASPQRPAPLASVQEIVSLNSPGTIQETLAASMTMRAGLSTELRRLVAVSALETSTASMLSHARDDNSSLDRTAERQHYWLERFHEHLESQERQQEDGQPSSVTSLTPQISRSVPGQSTGGTSSIRENDFSASSIV